MSEGFRDRLHTSDERGHRLWVYADLRSGGWRKLRVLVARTLIAIYFILPWVNISGLPLLRFDILNRRLFLAGLVFWPHELGTFIPLILSFAFLIFAMTSWVGRFWCGWMCPQTVYLEFIYRPIEQWIEGRTLLRKTLDALPWTDSKKYGKKVLKWVLFVVVSFLVANNFLAYFVGPHRLLQEMAHSPSENTFHFGVMAFITACFTYNFGWFREQMCTITCPYGRLQSVLLDRRSLVVGYDASRGEPRGKSGKGDCVDCGRCVQVCPTGIDIRDGTQMECINCTACIDACNYVMDTLHREKNLISYTTQEKMEGIINKSKRYRPWIYSVLTLCLFVFALQQVHARHLFEVVTLRSSAVDFTKQDGMIQNHVRLRVESNSTEAVKISIEKLDPDMEIIVPQNNIILKAFEATTFEIFTKIPMSAFSTGETTRRLQIKGNDRETTEINLRLFGVSQ